MTSHYLENAKVLGYAFVFGAGRLRFKSRDKLLSRQSQTFDARITVHPTPQT